MRRAQSKSFKVFALLGEDGEARLFQQVDLAIFDVAVIQSAHAAEQIAEFDERDQSGVLARRLEVVVQLRPLRGGRERVPTYRRADGRFRSG